jgi:hypothetical protein
MAVVRPGAPVLGLYERQFVEFGYLENSHKFSHKSARTE